jgi:hypothetical protein
MISIVIIGTMMIHSVTADYVLGNQGESCTQVCYRRGLNCNPRIVTNNGSDIFTQVGAKCTPNPKAWSLTYLHR